MNYWPEYNHLFQEKPWGAPEVDEHACLARCRALAPDCGGFTYFPKAVYGEANAKSCLLKRIQSSYNYRYANDRQDAISGSLDCFEGGKALDF